VSRSGYYAYQKRLLAPKKCCLVTTKLKAAFHSTGKIYGSRRLRPLLADNGIVVGRYKILKIMKKEGIKPLWKPKFIHTTDSKHDLPVSENILNREFNPSMPNQSWVCDITYIRTQSGWLYLAAVMDLYARKIVGWAMSSRMPSDLVCSALKMAIAHRNPGKGLIVHSDRGSQYASEEYQKLLKKHEFRGSMSRKGNCWDNAVMERFFLNLKMERVWQRNYANHQEAIKDIHDYIVDFYNATRLHSTLGYLAPNEYEQQAAKRTYCGV
jgi:transposase InsO family protein